jgi:hypothetical protein
VKTAHPARTDDVIVVDRGDPFILDSQSVRSWPPGALVVDDMVDCYLDWRECASEVAAAYQRWRQAPREEGSLRYSAYTASLDQEDSAAILYELAVADVEQWLERSRT